MKGLILSLGIATATLLFAGTASADHRDCGGYRSDGCRAGYGQQWSQSYNGPQLSQSYYGPGGSDCGRYTQQWSQSYSDQCAHDRDRYVTPAYDSGCRPSNYSGPERCYDSSS